ncbi:tail fiber assembly protein [Pseudomonas gingeri]|uniref:tail fiber assembly protein n=1 Tax=Pseudomonas gingeri TaxID=117681 RepID=UPI00159F765B|nr:tail fiber assembly protein [Pseudomonas gingeri]NWE50348.1 tail fiber assembly protein [Pseudomonas gingeri]
MKKQPIVYVVDPVSRELIGTNHADPDPLDADNWLIPGFSYVDEPPAGKNGYAIVRSLDGNVWEYVQDNRGVVYRIADGQSIALSVLGAVPSEYTTTPWPGEFYFWANGEWVLDVIGQRSAAIAKADLERDRRLSDAALRIAPLQDAVDLGNATAAEAASLNLWKHYRVGVNRISEQPGFPEVIDWPVLPA